MPADRKDLSGLLYLPGEDLVRSTVDGAEADWSNARSYVPSATVVRRVLDASQRARPRFILPPWLEPSAWRAQESSPRARAAAAMFGAFGLSPTALAAVAFGHALALIAAGPWISAEFRAASLRPAPRPVAIAVVPLVYASSPTAQSPKRRRALLLTGRPERAEREGAAALTQELHLSGPSLEIAREDLPKLEVIVRVLAAWPGLRLRVVGDGPRPREGRPAAGVREAQAVIRRLVAAGVSRGRIDSGRAPENRRCAERDLSCSPGPSLVRTMEARSRF